MDYPRVFNYEKIVKVSSWHDWMQAHPLDNAKPNHRGGSHYRTLGLTDEIFMPKTSTQELLESGLQRRIYRITSKHIINFESYPVHDYRLSAMDKMGCLAEERSPKDTTYREHFKSQPMDVKERTCKEEPDRLLNRIPKCGFELFPSSENKFMDDHLIHRGENRKKIDFLRQIRNASNVFH